jgi:uridine kinase
MKPVIIGIAGGSGSGKTSITNIIANEFVNEVTVICQDAYYKSFTHLPFEDRQQINFDHPDSFDTDYLLSHIKALKKSVPVQMPVYDYKIHARTEETIPKNPTKIIIVEGILIFDDERLRDQMDIKLFVDTDSDVRILRRIERDMKERGRTLQSVITQYRETVRPMHIEFIEPTKRFADLIIPEGGRNYIAIDMILSKVQQIIERSNKKSE